MACRASYSATALYEFAFKLTIVEPGGFRTDWAGASMAFAKPMAAYAPVMDAIRGFMGQHSGNQPGDPRKAGQVLLELVEMEQLPVEQVPLAQQHPASIAAHHARNFRDGLQRMARYKLLCGSEEMRLTEKGGEGVLEFSWLLSREKVPLSLLDAAFASMLQLGKRSIGVPVRPLRIELRHPPENGEMRASSPSAIDSPARETDQVKREKIRQSDSLVAARDPPV